MRRSLLSITLLALALPGCGDEPTKESAIAPKAAKPAAAVTATSGSDAKASAKVVAVKPSVSLRSASARSSAPSTVCARYRAQLNAAKAKLTSAPSVTTLKAKVANLETLVADACQ
ncbi:MAG TPA: hypothetical protein VFS33_00750 [Gemmatimonadales bacterium]|nr:hypothetical protein [Gemmatimonadales bacterium]